MTLHQALLLVEGLEGVLIVTACVALLWALGHQRRQLTRLKLLHHNLMALHTKFEGVAENASNILGYLHNEVVIHERIEQMAIEMLRQSTTHSAICQQILDTMLEDFERRYPGNEEGPDV